MTGQRLSDACRKEIAARLSVISYDTSPYAKPVYIIKALPADIAALEQHAEWADEEIRKLVAALELANRLAALVPEDVALAALRSEPQPGDRSR